MIIIPYGSDCQSIEQNVLHVEHGTLRAVFSVSENCSLWFFLKYSENYDEHKSFTFSPFNMQELLYLETKIQQLSRIIGLLTVLLNDLSCSFNVRLMILNLQKSNRERHVPSKAIRLFYSRLHSICACLILRRPPRQASIIQSNKCWCFLH